VHQQSEPSTSQHPQGRPENSMGLTLQQQPETSTLALSPTAEDVTAAAATSSSMPQNATSRVQVLERGLIVLDGKKLDGGTLVWAKADTFPWWPAVVFGRDDVNVPRSIKKKLTEGQKKSKNSMHIVQFYDKQRSWDILLLDKLRMLGEDDILDAELLASNSKIQRWKNRDSRDSCREAYKHAKAEMEIGDGLAAGEVPEDVDDDISLESEE